MPHEESFAERAVKVEPAAHRYSLLQDASGRLLGMDGNGALTAGGEADDSVVWDLGPGGFRHVASGRSIAATDGCATFDGAAFAPCHGPEKLPSEHLRELRANGWSCLTGILAPEVVDGLQRTACTDAYADSTPNRATPQFSQHAALARTAAEPVSLWVIRQYLGTPDIHFSHTPALIVLGRDDGQRNVQGWHSDYPYHWGINVRGRVPELPGEVLLGVQRNVCVSEFTKVRGATAFKLGSHALNHGPPEEWGTAGCTAAPATAPNTACPTTARKRTWWKRRRAASSSTTRAPGTAPASTAPIDKRAAMLQAMTPMFVMPKNDTSAAYKHFLDSAAYQEINERERAELRRLMVHRFLGPGGRDAIGPDAELSAVLQERAGKSA